MSEQVGVTLSARNETQFTSAMDRGRKAVDAFVNATRQGAGGLQSFSTASIASGVAIGSVVSSAITGLVSKLGEVASGGVAAAAGMQTLTVSLEMLAARELVAAGGAENVAEALDKTGPIAQNTLKQLEKLSLASPFEYQSVLQIFRLNQAFGQTTQMSLKLTKAITDMTAASGQTGAVAERIAYNFSQMSLTGQVTMRDVRDLALAGVDLEAVLRDELGMSIDEVNDALKAGQITMEDVSEAFVRYADKNFGGAAERMAKTATGLVSSFKDLAFFSSRDIFGPALETVTRRLERAFDKMQGFIESGGMKTIGRRLDELVSSFLDVGEAAAAAGDEVADSFGLTFDDLVDKAFDWGANIINNLALGMIQAVTAVIEALTFIGEIITYWLEPGSPPRLLPDLDKWGAEAMSVYMGGWAKGDFGIFADIATTIERSLRAGVSRQDTGIIPRILGSRSEMARALQIVRETGRVTEDVLERVYSAGEIADENLRAYIRTSLEYAAASERVRKAQEAVNRITEKYDRLLKPLQDKLASVTRAQDNAQALRRISQLQLVLTDVNATAADKEEARLEIERLRAEMAINNLEEQKAAEMETAQAQLDAATQEQQAIADRLDAQRQLVAVQAEQNELIRQQIDLLERLASQAEKAAKKVGGGGGGGLPKKPAAYTPVELAPTIDDPFAALGLAPVGPPAPGPFEQLKGAIDGLAQAVKDFNEPWGKLESYFQDSAFGQWLGDHLPDIIAFVAIFSGAKAVIGGVTGAILALVTMANPVGLLITALALLATTIIMLGPQAWETLQMLGTIIGYFVQQATDKFNMFMGMIVVTFAKIVQRAIEFVKNLVAKIQSGLEEMRTKATIKLSLLVAGFETKFLEIKSKVENKLNEIRDGLVDRVHEWADAGKALVNGLREGIENAWEGLKSKISKLVNSLPQSVKNLLGIRSPSKVFATIGESLPEGMAVGVENKANLPGEAMLRAVRGMISPVMSMMHGAPVTNISTTNYFNLGVTTNNSPQVVTQSFEMMMLRAA